MSSEFFATPVEADSWNELKSALEDNQFLFVEDEDFFDDTPVLEVYQSGPGSSNLLILHGDHVSVSPRGVQVNAESGTTSILWKDSRVHDQFYV